MDDENFFNVTLWRLFFSQWLPLFPSVSSELPRTFGLCTSCSWKKRNFFLLEGNRAARIWRETSCLDFNHIGWLLINIFALLKFRWTVGRRSIGWQRRSTFIHIYYRSIRINIPWLHFCVATSTWWSCILAPIFQFRLRHKECHRPLLLEVTSVSNPEARTPKKTFHKNGNEYDQIERSTAWRLSICIVVRIIPFIACYGLNIGNGGILQRGKWLRLICVCGFRVLWANVGDVADQDEAEGNPTQNSNEEISGKRYRQFYKLLRKNKQLTLPRLPNMILP